MMKVGVSKPGCSYSSQSRTKEWKDVQILAYIQNKSGEYDENESEILSDPWLDGYRIREQGRPISSIKLGNEAIRAKTRSERYKLKLKGWHDCDEELKALTRFAAGLAVLLLMTCTRTPASAGAEYYDHSETITTSQVC